MEKQGGPLGPPVAGAQTAWEDTDQVSFMVCGTPTDKPGPEQPWTDQSPPGEKRETE
jgi:hypothetical protein